MIKQICQIYLVHFIFILTRIQADKVMLTEGLDTTSVILRLSHN